MYIRFDGEFKYNWDGRHVCHQLAEDIRSWMMDFSMTLWKEACWATYKTTQYALETRTIGEKPYWATILSCVCKQGWKAKGCQPGDQTHVVGELLEWGCDANSSGSRGDTVMMQIAGAGHLDIFTFLCHRIVKHW